MRTMVQANFISYPILTTDWSVGPPVHWTDRETDSETDKQTYFCSLIINTYTFENMSATAGPSCILSPLRTISSEDELRGGTDTVTPAKTSKTLYTFYTVIEKLLQKCLRVLLYM